MVSVTRAGQRAPTVLWGLALLWTMLALGSPQVAAAASVSPLPESDYTTRSACSAPEPGHASCLALELVPRTTAARARVDPHTAESGAQPSLRTKAECLVAFPSACLTPQQLNSAYFPSEQPETTASKGQTIALVDAYNDPKALADLGVYDEQLGLPPIHACSGSEGGCFEQVNQSGAGELPFPRTEAVREAKEAVCVTTNAKETSLERTTREAACVELVEAEEWSVEISTDIELAHGVCQNCKILLVEANTSTFLDLEAAEETAVRLGATEISNSWGGPQEGSGKAFSHPGTVITAAAGDNGYLNWTQAGESKKEQEETGYFPGADYPAASPKVVAVGGTKLTMSDGVRESETVWNEDPDPEGTNQGAGGSGCAGESLTAQPWQQAVPDWAQVGCGSKRAVADVSADADPYTGVAIYDSVPNVHEEATGEVVNAPLEWWPIGGTSVASPIIASIFALAGGAHGVAYPAQTLYSHLDSPLLHDVTSGGNGHCDDDYLSCSGSMVPLSPLDCGEGVWICNATTGYDGPTGVGTPNGIGAFKAGESTVEEGGSKAKASEEEAKAKASESQGGGIAAGGGPGGGGSPFGSASGNSQGAPSGLEGTSGVAAKPAPLLSALRLTANALTALRHGSPHVGQLAFSFRLSRATTVRVMLAVQIGSAAHRRWRRLPAALAFAAIKGLNGRRLHGSRGLAPGLYRLTLTPAGGRARSIAIRIR
jgi:hypothetical protein